jgi:hypothetical protein
MPDALAPLLVASPGSGPPGSPNLSPKVFGRASGAETNRSSEELQNRPTVLVEFRMFVRFQDRRMK